MAIQFSKTGKGPSITIEDTTFIFKQNYQRVYQKFVTASGLFNNGTKFDEKSPEEQEKILELDALYMAQNLFDIKNLLNEDDGQEIKFEDMSDEFKLHVMGFMLENEEFSKFCDRYKDGAKKKL